MTNAGVYRYNKPGGAKARGLSERFKAQPEQRPRDVANESDLILSAMLAQRVRVARADGVHWMSGYDALASVLNERSAAGDARASALLDNLSKYAALAESRKAPPPVAPQTPAEKELAHAFVRRTIDGLPDEPRKPRRAARKKAEPSAPAA